MYVRYLAAWCYGGQMAGRWMAVSRTVRTSRRRMPIHQAAAIWTLVFLIGLTGGELLRQQTLDAKPLAMTRGPTEQTAATSTQAAQAAARSATLTATTATSPPQPTTTVDCDRGSCPDQLGGQGSRIEDGKGRGPGTGGKEPGHGKHGKPQR
jgi:hypothetical protein